MFRVVLALRTGFHIEEKSKSNLLFKKIQIKFVIKKIQT